MKPWLILYSLLVLLCAPLAAVSQDKPKDEVLRGLIDQLGDDVFEKREAAEERLIDLGVGALEALRAAAKNNNFEIAFRSQRAIDRITTLSPAEQEDLRNKGQAAFHAGDYEQMARRYRRLVQAHNATIDDGRWLGHAYQLAGQWKEAAAAYRAVLECMEPLLDRAPPFAGPGSSLWPSSPHNGLKERAAIIVLIARLERFYLKDPVAAEKTLKRVFLHDQVLREPLDALAGKWRGRLAAGTDEKKDLGDMARDLNLAHSLPFPLKALRELAGVQEQSGKPAEAFETWRRIHLTTRCYVGFTESIDSAALDRLIQALPEAPAPRAPGVTLLSPESPTAEFDLHDADTLFKSYDIRQNYWSFALAAKKGLEFESLEFTCDIEQIELRYGGQFDFWTYAGEQGRNRKGLGSISWPNGKAVGRDKITAKFAIEPGTGLVHFSTGTWKDKFNVHGVKVTATFRKRSEDPAAPKPIPGFTFHTEFLPPGGSITWNGESYGNEYTRHNVTPGKSTFEYSHPRLKDPRRFTLDLKPGANYSLFLNLDSPLSGELTNLRGIDSHYGPCTSLVKMRDGRWLVAWCSGGLRFASSDDLVTWSQPTATADSALFSEHYKCLDPTLYVDKTGTIWVAYFSNQLDIDQLNSGGYRLFLRSSKDGREWTTPRPLGTKIQGWPPGHVQMLDGPDGKTWMLYRMQYAVAETPADFTELKDLEVPVDVTQRSHARNPHATFDTAGRMHLVWDHFAQSLLYSRRDVDGKWSAPIGVGEKDEGKTASNPHLVVRGEQLALIYNSNSGTFLRRGSFQDGAPKLGEAIKLAPHTAPVISASPLLIADDRIVFLCGKDTVWRHTGSIKELLGLGDN